MSSLGCDIVNKILNFKSEKIINLYIADTLTKRFLGYMLRKQPHHEGILLKPCNSIHTYFMRFDIDILFVDKNLKVIKKINELKPGKIIMPVKDAAFVIEAKSGLLTNCNEGDILVLS